jgi:hypothetical protein
MITLSVDEYECDFTRMAPGATVFQNSGVLATTYLVIPRRTHRKVTEFRDYSEVEVNKTTRKLQ